MFARVDRALAAAALKAVRATARPSVPQTVLLRLCNLTSALLANVRDPAAQASLVRRHLLAPNERWEDCSWAQSAATLTWLRRWWITAHFRGTEKYLAAGGALRDAPDLPSLKQTKALFGMGAWDFGAATAGPGQVEHPDELRQASLVRRIEQASGCLRGVPTVDVLDAAGCCVHGRNEFNAWCEAHQVFEFLTRDFIDALAKYLRGRLQAIARAEGGTAASGRELLILDLGAGSGKLAGSLSPRIDHVGDRPVRIVAVDNKSWPLKERSRFPVQQMDYKAALARYQPDVVLVSWMPMDHAWDANIRACPSVREYVLIGEADDGCCGHNWLTWGNPDFLDGEPAAEPTEPPPYAAEGWSRTDLDRLRPLQLSRFDNELFVNNSRSVSFRRLHGAAPPAR